MWKLFLIRLSKELFIRSTFIGTGSLGCLTLIPNIMIADNGATLGANIGVFSSGLFMLSGIIGLLHCKFIPINIAIYLIPTGLFLQLSSFIVAFIFHK